MTPVHRELLAQHKEHLLPFVEWGFAAEGTEGQGGARVSRCAGEHSSELLACGRCFSLLAPVSGQHVLCRDTGSGSCRVCVTNLAFAALTLQAVSVSPAVVGFLPCSTTTGRAKGRTSG